MRFALFKLSINNHNYTSILNQVADAKLGSNEILKPYGIQTLSEASYIYGEGIFIHSATKVRINSLIPTDENYYDGSTRLIRASRILGNVDKGKDIWSIPSMYKQN